MSDARPGADVAVATIEINYPSVEGAECPYPVYEHLRRQSPIHHVPGTNHFLISRWEDIRSVTRRPELFSNDSRRSVIPFDSFGDANATVRGLQELDPPAHKQRRDACFRSFTQGRMKAYAPLIDEYVTELIDGFIGNGQVELVSEFSSLLPMRVMMHLFGLDDNDFDWVRRWSFVETSGIGFLPPDVQAIQREYAKRAGVRLLEEIMRRFEEPRDDVLTEIVQRNVELAGEFDAKQIRADASNIFRGGIITVGHAIPMAMQQLLSNPTELDAVRADPRRIPRMFEEALRLEAPSQWSPRVARRDTDIAGVKIPAGAWVILLWASGNRDEDAFPQPGSFAPLEHSNVHHFSFGDGPHFCLGAPLARLEARIAFEQLLARLENVRLSPDDVRHLPSPKFRGLQRLLIDFTPA